MKHSHSAGAIGILGVKKTVDGVWLYFAHNTDSFVSSLFSNVDSLIADACVGCSFNVLFRQQTKIIDVPQQG